MRRKNLLALLVLLMTMSVSSTITACGGDDDPVETPAPVNQTGTDDQKDNTGTGQKNPDDDNSGQGGAETSVSRYVGGDISMLTKYEEQRAAYADVNGKAVSNMLDFLKEQGWNTMRVRLFVDPSKDTDKAVCQDLAYAKALGKRIKDAGLQLMLDFHYSDTWADPGKQWTPDAWKSMTNEELYEQIYTYTKDCLQQMVAAGATPDLIQTGNEISYGMMWGTKAAAENNNTNRCYTNSPAANWTRFTTLLKQAGKACREVCPKAEIIIHSERTQEPDVLIDFFDRMKTAQIDYDIIGLSYYPYFHGSLSALDTALKRLEAKNYGKQIQVVETGYTAQYAIKGDYDYSAVYPITPEGQRQFTADLVSLLKQHAQVNGLLWWYPEANAKSCTGNLANGWYNAGLFDNTTGRALPALYELKNFK